MKRRTNFQIVKHVFVEMALTAAIAFIGALLIYIMMTNDMIL